jgi:signal transduction histidine kinase
MTGFKIHQTKISLYTHTAVHHCPDSNGKDEPPGAPSLQQSQELLQAFFNTGRDYQVLLCSNLSIVTFNEYAAVFTKQYLHQSLYPGMDLLQLMGKPFAKDFKDLSTKALAGETVSYEHYIRSNIGERLWFRFTLTPMVNPLGNIVGLSLVGSNINELKRQEKTIRNQSDTLGIIAQLQSHQVRQPVSSILGLMTLIKEENYAPPKEYFDGLEQATRQLDEVIQAIVTQSRS